MRKQLKISVWLFFMMLLCINTLGKQQISVVVNGMPLQLKDQLIAANGKTYISLRDIGNAFGYEFNWSAASKTANLKSNEVIIALQPDNKWFTKKNRDGKVTTYAFDAADVPRMMENKLYVPIGNFTTVAGGMVEWDGSRNTYNIIYDWNLNYVEDLKAILYAGNAKKGMEDGLLAESRFKFAQSICATDKNGIYIADAGSLRKIIDGKIEKLDISPDDLKITMIRKNDGDIYALSGKYKNDKKEEVYSIFKLDKDKLQEVYSADAKKAKIVDFDVMTGKGIGVLKQDLETKTRVLEVIYTSGRQIREEVDADFNCMAIGEEKVYLGSKQRGSIYCFDNNERTLKLFAGVDNKHQFADGNSPLFCGPRRMKYLKGNLYVLDYNVLRKVFISNDGTVSASQSIAGKVTALINPVTSSGVAKEMQISSVNPIDFDVNEEGIFLTDANQFKILKLK